MKQLLILSGKGGTGKTTIASAFIKLSKAKSFADCDVDAPNLHLIMAQSSKPYRKDYFGLPKAEIDIDKCIGCGLCRKRCRFDAITYNSKYQIDNFACEGCGVCEAICPAKAITLKPAIAGELMLYTNKTCIFSTAQLKMGGGASGKLVSEVKKQMIEAASKDAELAIIDGSPGIGCPVIASLSGVDMVIVVAEPSISGISDMQRIIKTAQKFQTKIGVCINKYDTNQVNTKIIEKYCEEKSLPFIGKIPFDPKVVGAINHGQTIVDIVCPSGSAVKVLYARAMKMLLEESESVIHEI